MDGKNLTLSFLTIDKILCSTLKLPRLSQFKPIEVPKKTPNARTKTDNAKITLWRRNSFKKLNDITEDIIIAPISLRHKYNTLCWEISNLYFVSETNFKKLTKLNNVQTFDNWIRQQKLSKENKNFLKYKYINNSISYIYKFFDLNIKNKDFNGIKTVYNSKRSEGLSILNDKYTETAEFKDFCDKVDNFIKELYKNCPMLKIVDLNYIRENNKKLLENYINDNF